MVGESCIANHASGSWCNRHSRSCCCLGPVQPLSWMGEHSWSSMSLDKKAFERIERAVQLATDRILEKGADDVFKPPIFAKSVESLILEQRPTEFRAEARKRTEPFLKVADLKRESIGYLQRGLVMKDENSFRRVAWLDPFDAVKYLAVAYLPFDKIEAARLPKGEAIIHSHRRSDNDSEIFDARFGYDSFREKSTFSGFCLGGRLRRSSTLRTLW